MALKTQTNNGAVQYASSFSTHVDFFSKAGSAFVRKNSKTKAFYSNPQSALELFKAMWSSERKDLNQLAFKLVLWCRDCRGGAGNRSGSRDVLKWLGDVAPEWIAANINLIPEIGRWDDLKALYGTKSERVALNAWANGIREGNGLACKWADRKDYKLRGFMGMNPKDYRKTLVAGTTVVETPMCAKNWGSIDFKKIPSVATARYANAFKLHCADTYETFITKVENGEVKINASTLFPHDLVRSVRNGDKRTSDVQWDALPNYLDGTDQRVMAIADTSSSMGRGLEGSIQPMDISQALALYCSDKIGEGNPFYRKYMQFCDEANLTDWRDKKLSEVIDNRAYWNGAVGSTDISRALSTLLKLGTMWKVPAADMPNVLLIISDMQFDGGGGNGIGVCSSTPVESELKKWEAAGYAVPKVVYWCVLPYKGSPAVANAENIGLVSGFSPSILKSIFSGKDFSPISIMLDATEKYQVVIPE